MLDHDTLLYKVEQIRWLEELAIKKFKIDVVTLMQRAGQSAFSVLRKRWPKAKNIIVVCGKGNNGGDGYVVAYLAHQARLKVKILSLIPFDDLSGAAKIAANKCKKLKIKTAPFNIKELRGCDLIVDAIFGTGLKGEINGAFKAVINTINESKIPIFALDVPSGIDADTGNILGAAIKASATITFIGIKVGLLVGDARDCTGEIICSDLSLPDKIWQLVPTYAQKLNLSPELKPLTLRKRNTHKGDFGQVVVVGGDYGMGGAVRIAAEAALRMGAGLVSVATRPKHALMINATCPEIMSHGVSLAKKLYPLLEKARVIIIGPGLGKTSWGINLFNEIIKFKTPMVVDADALNILATKPKYKENWILTPHPGEAARLLGITSQQVQAQRLFVVEKIQKKFGGICVLKGAGTLIAASQEKIRVCDAGNPGMASAGMGDLLSGIIAGVLAQGLSLFAAAKLGVLVHSMAGDLVAAKQGQLGILALDLLPEARNIINAKTG